MAFFTDDFLKFFIELAGNNNKDWFDLNRKRYEDSVKNPFKKFVEHIIKEIAKKDARFKELEAKDCIFRINRDIRFSSDKTPYKLMTSAVVAPEGKKSKSINGIYFEFGPEHVRAYGGIYEIEKDDLLSVREGIATNIQKFQKLYKDPAFTTLFKGGILGEKNKKLAPELKEFAEKEPLIYNKQWYFYAEFDAEKVLSNDLDKLIIECYEAGKPIEDFFNELIHRR